MRFEIGLAAARPLISSYDIAVCIQPRHCITFYYTKKFVQVRLYFEVICRLQAWKQYAEQLINAESG
jgi:hypothetical protein